ncbi:hypothetical protein Fbal_2783 [Ferrimonas balearica DSM 9799]|uniref:Uncharacterized protein n=1 Tax=Ferrimonas balearica (strain DSM 9799 / CCM 4581 / KCTC 23876 / PAT) TaxID=550540 RepID=E1SRR4_FERBD|nr:hypothetical protein Fbal_2783 [Ferrimonas balearica DSM 9799]
MLFPNKNEHPAITAQPSTKGRLAALSGNDWE